MNFLLIFFLSVQVVFAENCNYVQERSIFRCQNVASLMEVGNELQTDWNRVEIVNRGGQFDVTGEHDCFQSNVV